MEIYRLKKDINLACVRAKSYPDGIQAAFDELNRTFPSLEGRTLYGVSKPVNRKIVYKAGVTENSMRETKKHGCETFAIKKGTYLMETIQDYQSKLQTLASVFQRLLSDPRLDETSCCVEWYKSDKELVCMVKIIE